MVDTGKIDVLMEAKAKAQAAKEKQEFLIDLDNQHLKFPIYMYAVMGKFGCDSKQAGEIIGKHFKGEY